MSFVIEVRQPLAHLILSKQINVLPGCDLRPPKEACGERVSIRATEVDWFLAQVLVDRYGFAYPSSKTATRFIWRKPSGVELGKWKNLKSTDSYQMREWIPNPDAFLSKAEGVQFETGMLGSVTLAGWLQYETGNPKAVGQYRPPGSSQAKMQIHKISHGPYSWVLRSPKKEALPGEVIQHRRSP